ncbi:unnamed protein product [Aspergillus oryzae]|nr:unnamed protein product [Aspergillus oryzae]
MGSESCTMKYPFKIDAQHPANEIEQEGKRFFDITERASSLELASNKKQKLAVTYPDSVQHNETVQNLIKSLDKKNFETVLQPFSEFHNRYYKSDNGKKSSEWLQGKIQEIISASGAKGVTVEPFKHSFPQSSLIAKIPGKSDKTIVLGAHQDSINLDSPSEGRAPGADTWLDDDGSGVVTILEAFRVLLTDEKVAAGEAPNTVEFHFYAGEEGGLLGSQDIFEQYSQKSRDVKAMLQQDMTGYTKGTTDAGKPESIGIITDNVDENLTKFLKVIVDAVSLIPVFDSPSMLTEDTCSIALSRPSIRNADTDALTMLLPRSMVIPPHSHSSQPLATTALTFTRPMIRLRPSTLTMCCNTAD